MKKKKNKKINKKAQDIQIEQPKQKNLSKEIEELIDDNPDIQKEAIKAVMEELKKLLSIELN